MATVRVRERQQPSDWGALLIRPVHTGRTSSPTRPCGAVLRPSGPSVHSSIAITSLFICMLSSITMENIENNCTQHGAKCPSEREFGAATLGDGRMAAGSCFECVLVKGHARAHMKRAGQHSPGRSVVSCSRLPGSDQKFCLLS